MSRGTPSSRRGDLRSASVRAVSAVVFVVLALVAGVARAEDPIWDRDIKTFAGTMCRPVAGTIGEAMYHLDGSISNNSAAYPLVIVCPIVRDFSATDKTTEITDVTVIDRHATGNVQCRASNHDQFGDMLSTDTKFSAGSGPEAQVIGLANVGTSVAGGYSALLCMLPPLMPIPGALARSRLMTYTFEEMDRFESTSTDSKSYTGAFAEQISAFDSTLPPPGSFIDYNDIGAAINSPPGVGLYQWAIPLVRDIVAGKVNRVRLRVDDADPEVDFVCSLYVYTTTGEVDTELSGFCDQESSDGETTVTCVPLELGFFKPTAGGPAVIWCLAVPPDSTVFMYDAREDEE